MILAAAAVMIGLEIQTTPRDICIKAGALNDQISTLAKTYHFSRFGPPLTMHSEAFCPGYAVTANEALSGILGPLGLIFYWHGTDLNWLAVRTLEGNICDPNLEDSVEISSAVMFPCTPRPAGFKWTDHFDLKDHIDSPVVGDPKK